MVAVPQLAVGRTTYRQFSLYSDVDNSFGANGTLAPWLLSSGGLRGPYLASGASDLVTGACVVASLQLAQSVLFPPPPLAGKLGIDHAPQGAVRRKEEACSGANGILPSLNTIALLTRKYLV